ncbi:MAG TPA: DUF4388 domain-containing protein [Terriglobales bacterium]|nr:DUF4388 domain-containing protein [Terriglobales bacterium]
MVTHRLYQESLAGVVREFAAKKMQKLLVTSAQPGEGRSWVVAGLGRALAASGTESVVMVDADWSHPDLHRACGLTAERGLADLLESVYQFDISREDPAQFGLGDWIEILAAQMKTGELQAREGDERFSLHMVKGRVYSVCVAGGGDGELLGELLVRRGVLTPSQRDDFLRVQQPTGRLLGEVMRSLGPLRETDLAEALREQAGHRLARLIALRRPDCRFIELAEPYLPAAAGRTNAVLDDHGVDRLVRVGLRHYLRDPYLASQVPVYLLDSGLPNLKLLPATRSFDLFAPRHARAFGLLLERLGRIFDIVLVDAPPISMPGPTAALSTLVDGVLLVVKADGTDAEGIRAAADDLRRAGANLLGVVLNQAEVGTRGTAGVREGAVGARSR